MRWHWLALILAALLLAAGPNKSRAEIVLYDGSASATPNQTPDEAPWRWGYQTLNKSNPLLASQTTQSAAAGVTTLDSTGAIADVAGYATHIANLLSPGYAYLRPDPQTLDAATGYTIGFTVKLDSEAHTSDNRAGFSVIALSDGATPTGIELGFWTNEVWAQNVGFTHGENSSAISTNLAAINYQLHVKTSTYTLAANGTQILTGSLRDYTSFAGGPPYNTGFPYNQASLLFFGDDTSEADASVSIGKITFASDAGQSPWQNAIPTDVNNDGSVTLGDATAIIQNLDANGIRQLAAPVGTPADYFDVSGDTVISPFDVLLVINYLNTPEQAPLTPFALSRADLEMSVAVPEPSSLGYAVCAALCILVACGWRQANGRSGSLLRFMACTQQWRTTS